MAGRDPNVEAWLALDWHAATRREAAAMPAAEAAAHLSPAGKRMEFGTAGLRSQMGAGFDRMNDVTVLQASQGLCQHLLGRFGAEGLAQRGVVIGYDARHNSQRYAHVAAAAFLAHGARVHLYGRCVATPLVPYWVTKQNCVAGIMVTASHNPKADNGYKVYADNGAQIIPPADAAIADSIARHSAPWPDALAQLNTEGDGMLRHPGAVVDPADAATAAYVADLVADLCRFPAATGATPLTFMYTAMHGVGRPFVQALCQRFGLLPEKLLLVPSQCEPDPEFPTVRFPNPEEKGALDIALAEAEAKGADYVIATDPDADRFVAAERRAAGAGWHVFSGDELGVLFADWQLAHAPQDRPGLLICSAVSSRMLGALAARRGAPFAETLTGFKWMANESLARRQADPSLQHLLAYEEAIGFQLSRLVPDKDGVSACAVWCEMAAGHRRERGSGLAARLAELRAEVGHFQTNNGYFLCPDPAVMRRLFDDFRAGGRYPATTVGPFAVSRVRDVTLGYDSAEPDKKCRLPTTPDAQMLTLYLGAAATATLRGSGTEPKLKYYCEASAATAEEARRLADAAAAAVIRDVLRPDHYGLGTP